MTSARYTPSDKQIFAFVRDCQLRQETCALVTITGLEGTGPRPRGAHMAVAASGKRIGYVTSGCLETAVTEEALSAIRCEAHRTVQYGENSRYLDFRLPCGGGLTFYIHVNPAKALIRRCLDLMESRTPFRLAFSPIAGTIDFTDDAGAIGQEDGALLRPYQPPIRFVLLGAGAELEALARVATATGYEVEVFSTDGDQAMMCGELAIPFRQLSDGDAEHTLPLDPWTAVIVLYHDRDREPELVRLALSGPAFYIGALGSAATHAERLDRLRAMGVGEDNLSRIHGPIGLIPAARDPTVLAISTMAEVIECYRRDAPQA